MHTDMDKLRGDTWACGDTRTRVGTDVREPVYTEYAHACPQTRMWGCTHRCTYSYVRGHTHTERPARASICNSSPKLYAISIPPTISRPSSPDLSPPIPEAPGSAQPKRKHTHTFILHFKEALLHFARMFFWANASAEENRWRPLTFPQLLSPPLGTPNPPACSEGHRGPISLERSPQFLQWV